MLSLLTKVVEEERERERGRERSDGVGDWKDEGEDIAFAA
jgi:hypothetical protein